MAKSPVRDVPTNVITGPLGAGKTTTIRHLLARRPPDERWAVLVNEFGEAGIDGAALVDASDDLAEVPGGCICCTARTQLRVTLTQLLRRVRPHRLLIEPTGLGHPAGIIDMLREPGLAEAIDLQSVIAVFPADGLTEERLAAAPPVRDAFDLADVLVLNKADRADAETLAAAQALAAGAWPAKAGIVVTEQGELDPVWLDAPARAASAAGGVAACELDAQVETDHHDHAHDHEHDHGEEAADAVEDEAGGFRRLHGGDAEHRSLAWVFPPETVFAGPALREWFRGLPPEVVRAKGVVRTGPHWQLFSRVDGELTRAESAWRRDSRVELLLATGTEPDPAWEAGLLAARQAGGGPGSRQGS